MTSATVSRIMKPRATAAIPFIQLLIFETICKNLCMSPHPLSTSYQFFDFTYISFCIKPSLLFDLAEFFFINVKAMLVGWKGPFRHLLSVGFKGFEHQFAQ